MASALVGLRSATCPPSWNAPGGTKNAGADVGGGLVAEGVNVAVALGVRLGGLSTGFGVREGVRLGVRLLVAVRVGRGVLVSVTVFEAVGEGEEVSVGVKVAVGLLVEVGVGEAVGRMIGVSLGISEGSTIIVGIWATGVGAQAARIKATKDATNVWIESLRSAICLPRSRLILV